jgi:hypothetical protein
MTTTTDRVTVRVLSWTVRGFGFVEHPRSSRTVFLHVNDVQGLDGVEDHPDAGDLIDCTIVETARGARALDARLVQRVNAPR